MVLDQDSSDAIRQQVGDTLHASRYTLRLESIDPDPDAGTVTVSGTLEEQRLNGFGVFPTWQFTGTVAGKEVWTFENENSRSRNWSFTADASEGDTVTVTAATGSFGDNESMTVSAEAGGLNPFDPDAVSIEDCSLDIERIGRSPSDEVALFGDKVTFSGTVTNDNDQPAEATAVVAAEGENAGERTTTLTIPANGTETATVVQRVTEQWVTSLSYPGKRTYTFNLFLDSVGPADGSAEAAVRPRGFRGRPPRR